MNKERFAQAVLARKEKFYRIAYAYVKNEQDALDIVGEATYKGLKSLHTLKSPEYFDTWMTRIVINTAADFLRKASRMGKLAIWRLGTHSTFGGTWLSDYVPNRLGGFVQAQEQQAEPEHVKPDCPLIGRDGNIFNLIGIASQTLRQHDIRNLSGTRGTDSGEAWENSETQDQRR